MTFREWLHDNGYETCDPDVRLMLQDAFMAGAAENRRQWKREPRDQYKPATFMWARYNDNTVAQMLDAGCVPEEIIGRVSLEKHMFRKELFDRERRNPPAIQIVLPPGVTPTTQ